MRVSILLVVPDASKPADTGYPLEQSRAGRTRGDYCGLGLGLRIKL